MVFGTLDKQGWQNFNGDACYIYRHNKHLFVLFVLFFKHVLDNVEISAESNLEISSSIFIGVVANFIPK